MSMWTAIVLIVIAAMAGEAYRQHVKSRGSVASDERFDAVNKRLDEMESELRERVETLERIVTDRSEDLKRQFESLDKTG